MRKPHHGWIPCSAMIVLAAACSGPGPGSDGSNEEPGLCFEVVDISGVTTDHASSGGVAWADVDGDGGIDLFVTNGYDVSSPSPSPQSDHLYRNAGGGSFEAITSGPLVEMKTFSSGSTWADYDNDGDLDVFVANQQDQDNSLFRNEGNGKLFRVEGVPPTADGGHSYAAGWVDVDNDGWLDLFVANGGLSHSEPNRLYRNTGDGGFSIVSEGAIVTDDASTCGFAWGDYDNDGDADLFVANQGFDPAANNNALYRNDGAWSFTKILDSAAANDHSPNERNRLYRNTGNDNHWVRIRLVGTASNRSAIGARVVVTTPRGAQTLIQTRGIDSRTGFRGQSAMTAHFGLGEAKGIVRLEVMWPSGERSVETDLAVDRLHEVLEPRAADFDSD